MHLCIKQLIQLNRLLKQYSIDDVSMTIDIFANDR